LGKSLAGNRLVSLPAYEDDFVAHGRIADACEVEQQSIAARPMALARRP